MRKKIIGVIGGRTCNKEVEQIAQKIGELIANVGAILVCGGFGGVMEAACKGAKAVKGETLGIISTYNKDNANKYYQVKDWYNLFYVEYNVSTGSYYLKNLIGCRFVNILLYRDNNEFLSFIYMNIRSFLPENHIINNYNATHDAILEIRNRNPIYTYDPNNIINDNNPNNVIEELVGVDGIL